MAGASSSQLLPFPGLKQPGKQLVSAFPVFLFISSCISGRILSPELTALLSESNIFQSWTQHQML